jgi:hypothetical protein
MPETTLTSSELNAFKAELLQEIKKLIEPLHKKPSNELIKSSQVMQILGCKHSKLQSLRKAGKLNSINVLGTHYYMKDDVDALFQVQKLRINH